MLKFGRSLSLVAAVVAGALGASAHAQGLGLPQLPPVGALPGSVLRDAGQATGGVLRPVERTVVALDPTRVLARTLVRRNPRALEFDDTGHAVVRGEVVALGLSADALSQAEAAGFAVKTREDLSSLDLDVVVLTVPKGLSASAAVKRLKALDPTGQYDVNPIYFESGAAAARSASVDTRRQPPSGRGLKIGLVDGRVADRTPSLTAASLTQRTFAAGAPKPSAHATALASLLAGDDGAFRGAAPGAALYVADVYGSTPAGGSAVDVARGLAWLAEARVPVINISLVGPGNAVLAAAVRSLVSRGHLLVAAVGNDGPAAPPLYPASYPGVVGVTGVDARRRVLPEAARGPQVAFAAPGADLAAAAPTGGYHEVRGTSYAAPFVAAALARRLAEPDPQSARRALAAAAAEAFDLGQPGPDPIYGRGALALVLAIPPNKLPAARR